MKNEQNMPVKIFQIAVKILGIFFGIILLDFLIPFYPYSKEVFGIENVGFFKMGVGIIMYISGLVVIVAGLLIGYYYIDLFIIKKIKEYEIKKKYTEEIKIDILIRNPFKYIEDLILLFIQSNNRYCLRNAIDYALRNTDEHKKTAERIGNITKDINDMKESLKHIEDRDEFIKRFNKIIDNIDNTVRCFIDKKDQWQKEFIDEKITNFINLYNIMCLKLDLYYDINDWGYHKHLDLVELIQRGNADD